MPDATRRPNRKRAALRDDHNLIRHGLAEMLASAEEIEVVGGAEHTRASHTRRLADGPRHGVFERGDADRGRGMSDRRRATALYLSEAAPKALAEGWISPFEPSESRRDVG